MSRLIFFVEIILLIVYSIIIHFKKKIITENLKVANRVQKVLIAFTIIAGWFLWCNVCMCGYPLVSIPVICFSFVFINFNWFYYIFKISREVVDAKLLNNIIIVLGAEVLVLLGLNVVFPEYYHHTST